MRPLARVASVLAFAGGLSACSSVTVPNESEERPRLSAAAFSNGSSTQVTPSTFSPATAAAACQWDDRNARRLTLAVAVDRALCAHPRIRDAKAAVDLERSQRRIAMAPLFPSISGTVTHARNETRTQSLFGQSINETQGHAGSLTLSWLLYDFGGRSAQITTASQLVIAAIASQDIVLQNAFVAVAEAYFSVATLTALSRIADNAIANSKRLVEAAAVRERMGAATPADRQYAKVSQAQAELFASRINEQLQLSRGDLATALKLAPDTRLTLSNDTADRAFASSYYSSRTNDHIGALIERVESHPQIREAAARAASSQAQIVAARSELWPKISLSANYYLNGRPGASVSSTRSNETYIGISLNYPIFDGFAGHHRVKAASAQHERNLAALDDARAQVKNTIWKAHQSSILSVDSHRSAQAVVESALAARAQAQIRYNNGANDITEWLRAEQTYFDARIEVIRAESNIRLARMRLMLALGDIGAWTFDMSARQRAVSAMDNVPLPRSRAASR
jgi:outer membrane protein